MKTMNIKQLLAGSVLYLDLPLPAVVYSPKSRLHWCCGQDNKGKDTFDADTPPVVSNPY